MLQMRSKTQFAVRAQCCAMPCHCVLYLSLQVVTVHCLVGSGTLGLVGADALASFVVSTGMHVSAAANCSQ